MPPKFHLLASLPGKESKVMNDFTSNFWNIYIAVLTILSILGCALLLWSQSKVKVNKKDQTSDGTTGHVWDVDLTELNTPMPRWWMWLFYLTILFGLAYLFLYPGLGSYVGEFGWDSKKAYQAELQRANAKYDPIFNQYLKQDIQTVAADPEAREMGERLFLTYCAQCHGSDARGSTGFPNLTDKDWLYGGDPETIEATILHGRKGVMPPMAAAIGNDDDVKNVANYVLSLSGLTHNPIKSAFGKSKFTAVCAACHGAKGTGNQLLGAPNLTDKVWLFNGDIDSIMDTIRKGRSNTMPAFADFLGNGKVHVLAAYVWGLSNGTAAEADIHPQISEK
jgi:cytochrome c oxidase cbb3-type subunit III